MSLFKTALLAVAGVTTASVSFAMPVTVTDTYIGGHTPSGYGDTIGYNSLFGINSLTVDQTDSQFTFTVNTNLADNTGVYPGTTYGGTGIGLGDLFLTSEWTPYGSTGDGYRDDNADTGTLWTYALGLDNHFGDPGDTGAVTLYRLDGGTNDANAIETQELMSAPYNHYRGEQEVLVDPTAATAMATLGSWSLTNTDLSLSIDLAGTDLLNDDTLAFHWAMYCANDVIEGQVDITPVPEPGLLALFGLGFGGLLLARRRIGFA